MEKHPYAKFENRREAGILLAQKLKPMVQNENGLLVLGLPRGGVPVASEVAQALDVPLDVLVVRKLGIPGYEETAMGAIASGGLRTLDARLIWKADISARAIHDVIQREQAELTRMENVYRENCPPLEVAGRTVILVDDGIATGSTVLVALKFLQQRNVGKVIIATPVCAVSALNILQKKADAVVSLMVPDPFYAVGAWYVDFSATQDEEVCQLLNLSFC